MTRARRALLIACSLAVTAGAVAACGEEGISDQLSAQDHQTAVLFTQRCGACHTLDVAGTQGSATNVRTREYKDGPNFNQRIETRNCVLFAIRNGGFSSGPMPQNIATGQNAQQLAQFIDKYSGSQVKQQPGAPNPRATDCPAG